MKAEILEVTACELNSYTSKEFYTFEVYEFENKFIMVPSETTNDWFFASRAEIEPCGNAVVEKIVGTGKFIHFTEEELQESIEGSLAEFGPRGLSFSSSSKN
jgi:hypothetical protein